MCATETPSSNGVEVPGFEPLTAASGYGGLVTSIPAAAAIIYVVQTFLKHMKERDDRNAEVMGRVVDALGKQDTVLTTLCERVGAVDRHLDSCDSRRGESV